MAITSAALQTALGDTLGSPRVVMAFEPSRGTGQQWLVSGEGTVPGRVRLITTTAADNAATQAAAVLAALRL